MNAKWFLQIGLLTAISGGLSSAVKAADETAATGMAVRAYITNFGGDHKVLAQVQVGRDPNWVGFTPDGKTAVVSNTGSGDVSLVDVKARKVTGTVKVGPSPKRLAVGSVVQ